MGLVELLTSGVGGFGLGMAKTVLSKVVDTVKDMWIAKVSSESDTKNNIFSPKC